jgi:hypothetical protein
MAESVSGIPPREDKGTAMRVLSLSGKPSVSRSGPAASRLIRKVSGLRRYRLGRFVGEAAMTNAGPLAGTRRCISPHVFAAVMARSGRLLSAVRPIGAVDAGPQGSRERRWSRGLPEVMGSRRRLTPRRGHGRRLTPPRGGGPKGVRPNPERRARLILRPRVITRRGHMPRPSCGLHIPPLVRLRLDPGENGAPERVELS